MRVSSNVPDMPRKIMLVPGEMLKDVPGVIRYNPQG